MSIGAINHGSGISIQFILLYLFDSLSDQIFMNLWPVFTVFNGLNLPTELMGRFGK